MGLDLLFSAAFQQQKAKQLKSENYDDFFSLSLSLSGLLRSCIIYNLFIKTFINVSDFIIKIAPLT